MSGRGSKLNLAVRRSFADPGSDGELLARFVHSRDESAFAAIVSRHGPLVLSVCLGVVGNRADAEDCFQAVFLVLAMKARAIRKSESLAAWLCGVAHRTALKSRARRLRRAVVEDRGRRPEADSRGESTWSEVQEVIHEELARLPDRFRVPLVLCYLRGTEQDAAAVELGLSKGTLKRRLEAGRARLRERMIRRGFGPAAMLIGAVWPGAVANATVPPPLHSTAMQHLTGPVPAEIHSLSMEVLAMMRTGLVKLVFAAVLAGGLIVLGIGFSLAGRTTVEEVAPVAGAAEKAADKPITAAEDATWSKDVNGLQARVVLVEKPRNNGTRMLHPYLELRNAGSAAMPLKVNCSSSSVKFSLVDAEEKIVDGGQSLPRSGPHPDPGIVSIPLDSTLRVGMHCTNWGIPQNSVMISTDSGAWIIKPEWNGKVFLRATVSAGKKLGGDTENLWFGNLETPKAMVAWSVLAVDPGEAKLREHLMSGTPAQKSAALAAILESKPTRLMADVIAAIEDTTSLPRDGDAGWGFVGHQAATVMAKWAQSIDGIELGGQPGLRPYTAYSFHMDQGDGGEALRKAGRLAEVRKNWAEWAEKLPLAASKSAPDQPKGLLSEYLGQYLTIEGEGIRAEGGKVETGTMLVDTVNGKKLAKPVAVLVRGLNYPAMTVRSIDLPAKRCVLKGYETGEMIGSPPGLLEAAEEQKRTDVQLSQPVWRWRPYFVARIAVEPAGLELPK